MSHLTSVSVSKLYFSIGAATRRRALSLLTALGINTFCTHVHGNEGRYPDAYVNEGRYPDAYGNEGLYDVADDN